MMSVSPEAGQYPRLDVQRDGEARDGRHGRVALPPRDAADVRPVQAAERPELVLGDAERSCAGGGRRRRGGGGWRSQGPVVVMGTYVRTVLEGRSAITRLSHCHSKRSALPGGWGLVIQHGARLHPPPPEGLREA